MVEQMPRQGKTMNKPTEKGLVPELRFPEFKNEKRWQVVLLSDICDVKGGKRIPKGHSLIQDGTGGHPYIRVTDMYMGGVDPSSVLFITKEIEQLIKNYKISKNDLFITVAGTIGIVGEIPDELDNANLTENANKIIVKDVNKKYLLQYLSSDRLQNKIKSSITNNAQPKLSLERIRGFCIPLPTSVEQQKIADCLSSLDELLSAHNQKLDALKAHKKGLMQQLFPAEGETAPKLRFSEFRKDGDWCFDDLGSKAKKVGSGITPKGGDKNYKSAGVPFVRSQNIGWGRLLLDNIAYIEEEVHQSFLGTEIKENDVLLNITGASIGRTAIADQRVTGGNVNQHVCIIRTKLKELHPVYLCQFILSQNGQLQIDSFQAGGNREGLNFSQIRSFSIPIPPNIEEQKKIADGLSSVDELITAQSKKINALEAHKKGLMQQLFPTVHEVSA